MLNKFFKIVPKLIFTEENEHFHQNLLSKQLFPIYGAFVLFAIIYTIQYILVGFMWKRIIFAFTLGGVLGMTILISKKYKKYTQLLLSIFFFFCSVLVDYLVIFDLKKHEMLYLGIYISLLFFNLIKGASTLLSTLAFSAMLLYFSFGNLVNIDDIITLFANLTICGLQCYMIFLDKANRDYKIKLKIKEKEKWRHIFSKIISGITILIAPEQSQLKLELVNEKGLNEYKITDITSLNIFLTQIKIINNVDKKSSKNNSIISPLKLMNENQPNLWEFLNEQRQEQNILKNIIETQANQIIGYYEPNLKKFKIYFSTYYWDLKPMIFIHLDDENFEDQIKFLKENDIKKNELLASVTHDLRSPLNGILAFITNAMETNDEIERKTFLQYAKINGHLLMSLINDILDYSSFINDKFRLTQEEFDLNELIQEVVELMRVQVKSKQLDFLLNNFFDKKSLILFSDSRRLKQILINLIGNSIKFTMRGFIKLKIKKSVIPNVIKFQVKDTGIGISSENINKLFKPYATFDSKEGLNKYGIGLGLNICRKFAGLLGPREDLIIKSKLGKGTTIGFLLYDDLNKKNVKEKLKSHLFTTKDTFNIMTSKFFNVNKDKKCDSATLLGRNKKYLERNCFNKMLSDRNLGLNFAKNSEIHLNKNNSKSQNNLINVDSSLKLFSNEEMDEEIQNIEFKLNQHNSELYTKINKSPHYTLKKKIVKIMAVDDNPFNNFVIQNFLAKIKDFDIKLVMANNGLECINIFKQNNYSGSQIFSNEIPFNLILMDCIMPIKDGYSATREIKALVNSGEYIDVCIIGISGLSGEEEESKCINSGMNYFMSKPICEKDLIKVVSIIFENIL